MSITNLLFEFKVFGKYLFQNKIIELEGGDKYSKTLRSFTKKKYKVTVGNYSYGGMFSHGFNIGGSVNIGNYCSFASGISYYGANHPMEYATMSPFFYNTHFGEFDVKDVKRSHLTIGNDVWCGYGVTITCRCKNIGNGSIIGAGSIVTNDIPPYSVAVGNPARVIKYRFDKETIDALEKSKWWELSPQELYKHYDLIDKPKKWAEAIMKL